MITFQSHSFPPPNVLGLPAQFTAWRKDQEYAIDLILNAPTRFVALTMPTGSGKSLVALGGAHLSPGRKVVLTANKLLQNQVGSEFDALGLVDIRGQSAYPCLALEKDGEWAHLRVPDDGVGSIGCDHGPCRVGLKCTLKTSGCVGFDKLRTAQKADLVLTNYDLWVAQARYSNGLLGETVPDLLLADEAHAGPDALADGLTLSLSRWLCSLLDLQPQPNWDIDQWRVWATYHAGKLKARLEAPANDHNPKDLKFRRWCKQAEQTLTGMSMMKPGNWIEDSTHEAYKFEILQPKQYAEQLLWQGAKKVVLLSATLTPKTLQLLGIAPNQVTHWECPSRFPLARRPVWYVPTANVKFPVTPTQVLMLASRANGILAQRPDVKGIGHTVSYKLAQQLHERMDNSRVRLHTTGQPAGIVVQKFKHSPLPEFLLSPSIDTGVDFPDDACRIQIVFRLPFPSTQSKIVQARAAVDEDYVPYLMIQRLVQSVGRGVRSETDWCETFILDDKWRWARKKYSGMMPLWFRQALKESAVLPPPLKVATL